MTVFAEPIKSARRKLFFIGVNYGRQYQSRHSYLEAVQQTVVPKVRINYLELHKERRSYVVERDLRNTQKDLGAYLRDRAMLPRLVV